MLEPNPKKQLGREFLKRLRSTCQDIEAFKTTLRIFASDLPENRVDVAIGLLAIGADQSEKVFDRDFALCQLAMLIYTCDLRGNMEIQEQLTGIIDDWIFTNSNPNPPWGALAALGRVNLQFALQKCDYVIEHYGVSEAGKRVRQLRESLERLPNP